MIRDRIRRWLGIDAIQTEQTETRVAIYDAIDGIRRARTEVAIHNLALGRIIAKIDPMFVTAEDAPARRAESDRLGALAIDRIYGEYKASNQGRVR